MKKMKNPHKQFPGKMDKTTERKYKLSFKMGYGKLKHIKMFESFDHVNENFTDEEMDQIKEAIKKNAMKDLKNPLEELGFIVEVNNYTMGLPEIIIEVRKNKDDKKRAVIIERKYTDDTAEFVHDGVALGIMEGELINEDDNSVTVPKVTGNNTVHNKFNDLLNSIQSTSEEIDAELPEYEAVTKAVTDRIAKLDAEYKKKKAEATKSAESIVKAHEDKITKFNIQKQQAIETLKKFKASKFIIDDKLVDMVAVLVEKGVYNKPDKDGKIEPKTTYGWKAIAELTEKLVPINEANVKALAEIKEANSKQKLNIWGPDLEITKIEESVNEGLLDWLQTGFQKAAIWAKDFFGGVIGVTPAMEAASVNADEALTIAQNIKTA